jgi:hypothetical protein
MKGFLVAADAIVPCKACGAAEGVPCKGLKRNYVHIGRHFAPRRSARDLAQETNVKPIPVCTLCGRQKKSRRGVLCIPCGNTERARARREKLPLPLRVLGARWIPLTRGRFALVSKDDYESVRHFVWTYATCGYAYRSVFKPDGSKTVLYMHKQLLPVPNGFEVDHRNGNTLDNRRRNLRKATRLQNTRNKRRYGASSRFKGVRPQPKSKKWVASIEGRYIGIFETEEEAAHAYDERAFAIDSRFYRLNFKRK